MRNTLIGLVILLAANLASATESENKPIRLNSSSHLGFALEDQSTTNFSGNAGSMGFFDFTVNITDNTEIGLRTLMNGARQPGASFYRLAAGPLLNYSPHKDWVISAMVGWFKETCTSPQEAQLYQSKGTMTMIGWERIIPIYSIADIALGGFVGFHSGDIRDLSADIANPIASRSPNRNVGRNRGVEIALRVRL